MILKTANAEIPIPKGAVKLTYAINDVRDPELREGAYSDSFELPKTSAITQALGYPDNMNVFDDEYSPYRKIPCEILDEGRAIVRGHAEILSSEKGYKVNVYGGNLDWFDFIKDRSIRDLDLSFYDHTYDETTIIESSSNIEGYVYPLIDYGTMSIAIESGDIVTGTEYIVAGTGSVTYNGSNFVVGDTFTGVFGESKYTFQNSPLVYKNNVIISDMFPATFVHTIVKQIFKEAGYKLSGTFPGYPLYKKLILPFNNKEFEVKNNKSVKAIGTQTLSLDNAASPSTLIRERVILNNTTTPPAYGSDVVNYDVTTGKYTATEHTFIEVTFCPVYTATALYGSRVGPVVGDATHRVGFNIDRNDTTTGFAVPIPSGNCMTSGAIEMFPGDFLSVRAAQNYATLNLNEVTLSLLSGTTIEFKDVSASIVGGRVVLTDTLPELKQGELISVLFNQFQLLTYTNAYTKTVYFEFAGKIKENLIRADDWSRLIDLTEQPEIEFSIDGYGRTSNFRYSESDEEAEVKEYNIVNKVRFGDGQSIFDNENLQSEVDVVELPVAATILRKCFIGSGKYMWLPGITRGSDPRILIYSPVEDILDIGTMETISFIAGPPVSYTPWAYFDKPLMGTVVDELRDSLSYGQPNGYGNIPLLSKYFPPVKSMVERPKLLKAKFRLKATHIAQLDHLVPKYIDRYKAYFYLNSVNEYSGEHDLTECELVKISLNATGEGSRTIITDTETGESYILTEDGDYILLEGGGRIPIE
jgi:hypothetical protein